MKQLSKVVWQEGMHLGQHHFQAQSRYFEDSIHFALTHLVFKPFGLVAYELDGEALRNGTVSLVHARGVMPDGLAFRMPDGDALPPPMDIRESFSATQESHLVLLAIPALRREGANVANPSTNGAPARYRSATSLVRDETTGRDERAVALGEKNFRLMLDSEVGEEDVALPIARVRRDGAGHFVYDPEYIPPCVQVGASESLMLLIHRVVEVLEAKSDAMAMERRREARSLVDYASNEVASFWLLHTVHSSLAPLRHELLERTAHPEQVYVELSRLAGALCTFALDADPRALPLYDHENLGAGFLQLEQRIRARLEVVIPTSYLRIPLEPRSVESVGMVAGPIVDERCFGRARWILGVRSSLSVGAMITAVPRFVKVCAANAIPWLVRRAHPGLTLEHLSVAPAAIAPRSDTQYFGVLQAGPCRDLVVASKEVGVYVPDSVPDAEIELLVVLES